MIQMETEPTDRRVYDAPLVNKNVQNAGGLVNNGVAPFRRRPQRRPDGVPDQPGAVPAHPLPAGDVRARHLRREGLPRTTHCLRDY